MSIKKNDYLFIAGLLEHLSVRRKIQCLFLLMLMILATFVEIISIGAVVPFIAVLTNPEKIYNISSLRYFLEIINVKYPKQILLSITIIFIIASIASGVIRLLLIWANTKLSFAIGSDLSISIYKRTLYQPYSIHVSRNSSEIISGITGKVNVLITSITSLLSMISSGIILTSLSITVLILEPVIFMSVFGGFGILYSIIIKVTKKKLSINGKIISLESTKLVKSIQEGLGGIRDVLIDNNQAIYCDIYRKSDMPLRHALGENSFISSSPRYIIESVGMILIAVVAYYLAMQPDGIIKAIPILGALALGAQRMLPLLQQLYGSWSTINGYRESIKDAYSLLEQPLPTIKDRISDQDILFKEHIKLSNISFRYSSENSWVLKNLNINIKKGSRVGLIGVTGCGKSTFIDIIMALLSPEEGYLEIDEKIITDENRRAWQKHIAHVPQTIYLTDSTIEENIAFGIPKEKIDKKRLMESARQAQLTDIIDSWPNGYRTFVGERGIRLSGGQRQRIGIARALYKKADVIIFDEATSSLDNATEMAVMDSIEGLDEKLTVIIIAHRLTTLKNCTQIIELANSGIKRIIKYEELMKENE
jgi:ABC-type multidrug transport system fused ATPase/permease subunit